MDRELDTEIAFHLETMAAELCRQGMDPAAAEAEARRRFGDVSRHRARMLAHDRRRHSMERRRQAVAAILDDLRHGVHLILRAPTFTATVVLTLALGIGANATVFGVVDRLLLRPPEQIERPGEVRRLMVERRFIDRRITTGSVTHPDFRDLAAADGFVATAAHASREVTVGRDETAQRARAVLASGRYFEVLGVRPAAGRLLDAGDARGGRSAVIGHAFWGERFGGDPDVVGQTIIVDEEPHVVVGVAPRGFTGVDLGRVDLWLPLRSPVNADPVEWEDSRGWYFLQVVARTRPGVPDEQVAAEATTLHRRGRADDTRYDPDAEIVLASLIAARGPDPADESVVSRWLMGVSAVVLLVACANVTNLLLARGLQRRREIGIRMALGVSRRRMMSHLLSESVVLAALGGLGALLVARWGGTLMRAVLLPDVHWPTSPVDGRVLAFTAVVALGAGLAAGLLPALRVTSAGPGAMLRHDPLAGGTHRTTLRRGLVVVQAGLSVLLLVGAGLFVRSLVAIRAQDLGLDPAGLVVVVPDLDEEAVPAAVQRAAFDEVARGLLATSGAGSAAYSASMPFRYSFTTRLRIPGRDELPTPSTGGPYIVRVSPGYLRTLGISVVEGRGLEPDDAPGSAAVVNETMARLLWPGERAVGKCLLVGEEGVPCTPVVGVAEDGRRSRVVEEATMEYYVPLEPDRRPYALFVRGAPGRAGALAEAATEAFRAAVPGVRWVEARPMQEIIDPQARSWRLGAVMFSVFGALALVVAAVGLYGVLSFGVARRTREIGVRAALGAAPGRLFSLVLRDAVLLAGVGTALGLALAVVAAPAIEPLLFEVTARDPVVLACVGVALMAVALAAAAIPAGRAVRVDPVRALRAE